MNTHPDYDHPRTPAEAKVRQVELLISNLLRTGVLLSLAIIIVGTTITFVRHPDYSTDARGVPGLGPAGPTYPHTVHDVFIQAAQGRGQAIIMLGLLVLLLTPVARVAVSILAFAYQGDRAFVVITSIVLGVLITSFLLGHALE